ncbi:hypothetical protein FHX37_2276 [Haloactinospora alba]|uniref:Uncharacterized protein n=1 Tax=Haloactinospora alba TaxID=405555 RepID=A0A543NKD8_9ACTN|nr:hypothetical protein [Haloactinospora alba]TQN32325.1 hypothetical protein FHX37_2276 [Haloactinospora alba]
MNAHLDGHPVEPDQPWPKSPTNVRIRCNTCGELRFFADRHVEHTEDYNPGPHCATCGVRIEFRCTVCDSVWRPLS